ncbi:MAG: hypothetical protein IT423_18295, partial [Pirellulaceae bacterium]|nr:hypothetical protein [Pirellulaceae bacterium]
FFNNVDQKLLDRLREQVATEERAAAIERLTGLDNPQVCHAIAEQNISVESLAALRLVPLITVAWADDRVEDNERYRLLQAAEKAGLAPGDPSYELLSGWLVQRPPEELFQTWVEYAQSLCRSLDGESRENLQTTLVHQVRSIATASGGMFGFGSISPTEQKVIDAVEEALA